MEQIKKEIMLVSSMLDKQSFGGRELLSKINYKILKNIFGDGLIIFNFESKKVNSLKEYLDAARGNIDGINFERIEECINLIRQTGVHRVFVDGSNMGGFTSKVKTKLPQIEVITFFHNVEARFFWGSLCSRQTLHALGVFLANTIAERKSVIFSDKIICLSDRDSKLLKKLYGRSANHITPMALEDQCHSCYLDQPDKIPHNFAIFVGGTFYANVAGIKWFLHKVISRLDIHLYIIGRGFEELREQLEVSGKVTVVGTVDSLDEWYFKSQFVIAPIFDGSGMKTKVAEALMHGKKIIGTPEAFSGYEDIVEKAGWKCKTPEEFIQAITEAKVLITKSFDHNLRELYEKNYSLTAAQSRFQKILSSIQ